MSFHFSSLYFAKLCAIAAVGERSEMTQARDEISRRQIHCARLSHSHLGKTENEEMEFFFRNFSNVI